MDENDLDVTVLLESPLLLAAVDCSGRRGGWTLSFARDLGGSPDAVWSVLTEPSRLGRWAPYVPDRDLGTAGPMTLTVHGLVGEETVPGEVLHAEPPVTLECAWSEDRLRWTLCRRGCGTRVTLRHTFTERAWAADAAAEWHLCLDAAQRLLAADDPGPECPPDDSRRQRLAFAYRMHLGLADEPDRR